MSYQNWSLDRVNNPTWAHIVKWTLLLPWITFAPHFGVALAENGAPQMNGIGEEERLAQKVKADVLRELQEGNWFADQIERGIDRYIQKVKAAQEAAAAEQARQANQKAKHVRPVQAGRDHIRGNPEAEVSLIEYSDFECQFCKRFHQNAQEAVNSSGGKVNWVYRHFPLGIHNPAAQKIAEAAECADAVGGHPAFWSYADAIFTRTQSNGKGFSREKLVSLAKELGLSAGAFQKCVGSGRLAARVKEDSAEGEGIGISGTPTTVLFHNKTGEARILVGAVSVAELSASIAQLLKDGNLQAESTRQRTEQTRP